MSDPDAILTRVTDDEKIEARRLAAERRAIAYRDGFGDAEMVEKRSAAEIAAWAVPTAAMLGGLGREYFKQRGETDRTRIEQEHETDRTRIAYGVEQSDKSPAD
jgi:hypothetical protein